MKREIWSEETINIFRVLLKTLNCSNFDINDPVAQCNAAIGDCVICDADNCFVNVLLEFVWNLSEEVEKKEEVKV